MTRPPLLLRTLFVAAILCAAVSVQAQVSIVGPLWTRGRNASVATRLEVSPDGRTIAAAALRDSSIRLWDAGNGLSLGVIRHPGFALRFLDNDRLIGAGTDGVIRIWSVHDRRERATVRCPNVTSVPVFAIDTVHRQIIWAGRSGTIGLADLDEPDNSTVILRQGFGMGEIRQVWLSPGGDSIGALVLTPAKGWSILWFGRESGDQRGALFLRSDYGALVEHIISASGRYLLLSGGEFVERKRVPHWLVDTRTGAVDTIAVDSLPRPFGFSDDDASLSAMAWGDTVLSWNRAAQTSAALLAPNWTVEHAPRVVTRRADGKTFVAGANGEIWRFDVGLEVPIELTTGPVLSAFFAPGDSAVMTLEAGRVRRWSTSSGALLTTRPGRAAAPVRTFLRRSGAFGLYEVFGAQNTFDLIRIDRGDSVGSLRDIGTALGLSTSGDRILISSGNGIELRDVGSMTLVTRIAYVQNPSRTLSNAVFSGDDRTCLVTTKGGSGMIVDLAGRRLGATVPQTSYPYLLTIAPDERSAIVGAVNDVRAGLNVVDLETGAIVRRDTSAFARRLIRLSALPGATTMATTDIDSTISLLDRDMVVQTRTKYDGMQPIGIAQSSDERFIVVSTGESTFSLFAVERTLGADDEATRSTATARLDVRDGVILIGEEVSRPVRLDVIDALGRRVASCAGVAPGPIAWKPDELADGFYLLVARIGTATATTRVMLTNGRVSGTGP